MGQRQWPPRQSTIADIYDAHADALFGFLLNLTRRDAEARDLLQALFAKLEEQAESLDYHRWMRNMPKGWWYQNFAATVEHMQSNAFDCYDRDRGILLQCDPGANSSPDNTSGETPLRRTSARRRCHGLR